MEPECVDAIAFQFRKGCIEIGWPAQPYRVKSHAERAGRRVPCCASATNGAARRATTSGIPRPSVL